MIATGLTGLLSSQASFVQRGRSTFLVVDTATYNRSIVPNVDTTYEFKHGTLPRLET